jgi:hypothetical protein
MDELILFVFIWVAICWVGPNSIVLPIPKPKKADVYKMKIEKFSKKKKCA